jgi:hypothetical protein
MEKAAISGGFFKVLSLWGHASSGHTKTYKASVAKRWQQVDPRQWCSLNSNTGGDPKGTYKRASCRSNGILIP